MLPKITCPHCGDRLQPAWIRHQSARLLGALTSDAKAASSRRNGAKGGRPRRQPPVGLHSPWIYKRRPGGGWVVDRLNRITERIERHGPYSTADDARAVCEELNALAPPIVPGTA